MDLRSYSDDEYFDKNGKTLPWVDDEALGMYFCISRSHSQMLEVLRQYPSNFNAVKCTYSRAPIRDDMCDFNNCLTKYQANDCEDFIARQ